MGFLSKLQPLLKPISFKKAFKFVYDKPVVGIDLGSFSIKILHLRNKKGQLNTLGIYNLPEEGIMASEKTEYFISGLSILVDELDLSTQDVAISLPSQYVFSKRLEIKPTKEKSLLDDILSEAERHIPYNLEDVYIGYDILAKTDTSIQVIVAAAKIGVVDKFVNMVREANLNPIIVDVENFALANAYEACYGKSERPIMLIDLGASKINMVGLFNGIPIFTREVESGGNDLTKAIQKEFGVSFLEAERLKIEGPPSKEDMEKFKRVFFKIINKWLEEIKTAVEFFESTMGEAIGGIYLLGGSSRIQGLAKTIKGFMNRDVIMFDISKRLQYNPKKFDSEYIKYLIPQMITAFGLSLRSKTEI